MFRKPGVVEFAPDGPDPKPDPDPPIAQDLISRGVTPTTARELARSLPPDAIAGKLEVFDWLVGKKDRRVSKNPAGYLAQSIRDDFATPRGFKGRAQVEAERLAAEEAERELRSRRQDARSRDEGERAEKAVIDAHLAGLTPEQQTQLEQEAFAASELNPRLFGRVIVRDHVKKLLGLGGA